MFLVWKETIDCLILCLGYFSLLDSDPTLIFSFIKSYLVRRHGFFMVKRSSAILRSASHPSSVLHYFLKKVVKRDGFLLSGNTHLTVLTRGLLLIVVAYNLHISVDHTALILRLRRLRLQRWFSNCTTSNRPLLTIPHLLLISLILDCDFAALQSLVFHVFGRRGLLFLANSEFCAIISSSVHHFWNILSVYIEKYKFKFYN